MEFMGILSTCCNLQNKKGPMVIRLILHKLFPHKTFFLSTVCPIDNALYMYLTVQLLWLKCTIVASRICYQLMGHRCSAHTQDCYALYSGWHNHSRSNLYNIQLCTSVKI